MISIVTAERLRQAGLGWTPAAGDRFVVRERDMDEEVFTVSDMVVERHRTPTGEHLRFNGTTEWALDQLQVEQALWLPREEQLRHALGDDLVALARRDGGWVVTTVDGVLHEADDPAEAYAAALLGALPDRA